VEHIKCSYLNLFFDDKRKNVIITPLWGSNQELREH